MNPWFRILLSRIYAALRKNELDRQFNEELETHLELLIEQYQHAGKTRAEARRIALDKLGHADHVRESHREQRGMPRLEALVQDLRYAVRILAKSPGFTAVAVLSLALGIGANTALFSLVNNLLLRSLPVNEPKQLVEVQRIVSALGMSRATGFPIPAFELLRTQNRIFSDVIGFASIDRPEVLIDGRPQPSLNIERVSENYFSALGLAAAPGRTPERSDGPAAVISYRIWKSHFEARPAIAGTLLNVNGRAYLIVGVAPPRFTGLSLDTATDVWLTSPDPAGVPNYQVVARLKPGTTPAAAHSGLKGTTIGGRLVVVPAGEGLSSLRAQYGRPLLALTVLVTLVLLITCTNIGNLLVVRNTGRNRELTVRVALGASRSRLIIQLLMENIVLAVIGGAIAVLVAQWGVALILSMLPLNAIPEALAFRLDVRVLAFTAGISLLSMLLFGLAPALRASKVDLATGVKAQGATMARGTRRLGRMLVAGQVALSVVLLVGAGLFFRTLQNLAHTDLGFNPENLLQVSLDTRGSGYRKGQVSAVYNVLLDRIAAIPGVRSVSGIRNAMMRGGKTVRTVTIPGRRLDPDEVTDVSIVGPRFFETMGIPVMRGRAYEPEDISSTANLIVINDSFAKRYFPNEDPIGRIIGDPPGAAIIGVVKDSRFGGLRKEPPPMVYELALRSQPDLVSALEVRSTGDPTTISHAVQQEVRRINPRLLVEVKTMRQEMDRAIAQERMVAATSAFFGALALVLACIGLFGVASYTVAQRTNELGIRIALGANRWEVVRQSLRETVQLFAVGLIAGTASAIVGVRFVASVISDLLFGLRPTDPANIVIAAALMVAVIIAACILPAYRATTVDPLMAIRYE